MNRIFTLTAITNRIQHYLEPAAGKSFWLKAEIHSGRERGGSFYCDLVETDKGNIIAQMRCTIWYSDFARIKKQFADHDITLKLDNGTEVIFQCSVQFHPRYGLSLKVTNADISFVLGELERKKQEVLKRLAQEGLLELNKKHKVPMLPQRIGLITAKDSAAYHDFVRTLTGFPFRIYIADSAMQGENTESSVLRAMDTLAKLDTEIIVIIRGGGSKTDLAWLDNEAIARKIAQYPMPVWTGIGHEIDMSILDHTANQNFKTPTAAAEELVSRYVEIMRYLDESKHRIKSAWSYCLDKEKKRIAEAQINIRQKTGKLIELAKSRLANRINQVSAKTKERLSKERTQLSLSRIRLTTLPINIINQRKERVQVKKEQCIRYGRERLTAYQKTFETLIKRFTPDRFITVIRQEKASLKTKYAVLKTSSPQNILKRGFSLVFSKGKIVKSVTEIKEKEALTTYFSDGEIISTIDSIKAKT